MQMVRLIFLISINFISWFSHGQFSNPSSEMNTLSDDYKPFSYKEQQVTYRLKPLYSPFYGNEYKIFDCKTGISSDRKVESILHNEIEGLVVNYLIKGTSLYEILLFKRGKTSEFSYNGVVKRDLNTLEQIGELVIFDEIEDTYVGAGQGLEIMNSEDGFYIIAGSRYLKKHYLKKFNYNLSLIWSINLDFLDKPGVVLQKTTRTGGNKLLMAITFSDIPKTSIYSLKNNPTRSSGLMLFLIDNDGASIGIFPEFEENLNVREYAFNYYPIEDKLVGVFSTTQIINAKKNEPSGIGYAYMVWDIEGNLTSSNKYYLTYEDLDGPNLDEFMQSTKIKNNILIKGNNLPSIAMEKNFDAFFQSDGSIIIAHEYFKEVVNGYVQSGDYSNSNLLYRIDVNGKLSWCNFFAQDDKLDYNVNGFIERENNLVIYCTYSAEQLQKSSNEYSKISSKFSVTESLLVMERVVDKSNGEVVSFKSLISEPLEKFTDLQFIKLPNQLLFEYRNSKKQRMRLVTIDR